MRPETNLCVLWSHVPWLVHVTDLTSWDPRPKPQLRQPVVCCWVNPLGYEPWALGFRDLLNGCCGPYPNIHVNMKIDICKQYLCLNWLAGEFNPYFIARFEFHWVYNRDAHHLFIKWCKTMGHVYSLLYLGWSCSFF